nr:MAG TPA: hypothetical protein [Caudoviricetes sp.]
MSHFFSDTGLIFCILSPPVDDLLPFPSSFLFHRFSSVAF